MAGNEPGPEPIPLPRPVEALTSNALTLPATQIDAPPVGETPARVKKWFDAAALAEIPGFDGTIGTARLAAQAYARHAEANNTRRGYRAGVRAWCAWCDQHALPCLPARSDDVVAFLAAERGRGLSVNTIDLRRAAIRYLHFIAGCAVPTAEAHVAETMARIHREAADRGDVPAKKLAATADILRNILEHIPDDLPGLSDRALLLVGFAGALRRHQRLREAEQIGRNIGRTHAAHPAQEAIVKARTPDRAALPSIGPGVWCSTYGKSAAEDVDRAVAADLLAMLQHIALRHECPVASDLHSEFEALAERWRQALVQASP